MMISTYRFWTLRWSFLVALVIGGVLPTEGANSSSVKFGYDEGGQLRSAHYDNGPCISYAYDQSGNRTAQTNASTVPGSPSWGTSRWGCFQWATP